MSPKVVESISYAAPESVIARVSRPRIYFPELDGLRFLAFLMVLIGHSRPLRGLLFPDSLLDAVATRISMFGWTGVEIFLVLSSFLIITLLLEEGDRTGTVDVGSFYRRRALRIWPLYFPYLAFAMLIFMPWQGIDNGMAVRQHLFPFTAFIGNFSYWYYSGSLSNSFAHLWTVCMEEQFYLVLPLIVYSGRRWSRTTVLSVLVGVELFTIACRFYATANAVPYPFVWSVTPCRLDPLVIGAVVALLARNGVIVRGGVMLAAALALFVLATSFGQIGTTIHIAWMLTVLDLAAACLLIGAMRSRVGSVVFGNRPVRYLGKISFGLYVYHEVCLALVWQWTDGLFAGHTALAWFVALASTLALDVAVSALSYHLWERRFILIKNRYEIVQSRPA